MYKVTKLKAFICLCICLFFMTSCKKKSNDKEKNVAKQTILGFSQLGSESSWRTFNSESIIKAAEENGIQILYDDAQQKQENQIKAIRSFIVYRVDLIAFAPIVEDGWDTVLKEAKDAHIPVIVVDREINIKDKSLVSGFIGENTIEEGRNAARFLLKKYTDTTEKLNILEITGTTNSSSAKNRSKGFREILKDKSQFSIIYSESGDFLRSKGKEILGQIIAYNNNELKIGTKTINIIFSHNDSMTLGILESLDNYGIVPGKDVT
ncbi:MAG: substrate-binding domain-containing protein, partial [Treponema sp.]|nr:substrate-binding domain-containing protein [Treponema sp.]